MGGMAWGKGRLANGDMEPVVLAGIAHGLEVREGLVALAAVRLPGICHKLLVHFFALRSG